jgi:subtilase family serine protease
MRKLALAVCVVMASGFLAVSPAHSSPPRLPPGRSKHVCVTPMLVAARCHSIIRTDENLNAVQTNVPAGYGPADLRNAYGITTNGTGTIAIVDAYGYPNAETDLAAYRAQFGLPPCTTANGCFRQLNEYGRPSPLPVYDSGWSQEQALDLDMASAICPGCKLILLEATTSGFADLSLAVEAGRRLRAHAISNSYGGSELYAKANPTIAARYNALGVAVTASNGDNGYGAQFPASSPYVTAVGGTSLVSAATPRGWSETAWSGTGSGCSAVFRKPSWQKDRGCTHRTVGDVAAVADPNTGVAVYIGGWYVFGGTSVASPIIAAIYAIDGGTVKHAYGIYSHPTDLNDVTVGSNGTCTPVYLCTAEVGYDGPTGLGTPKGAGAFVDVDPALLSIDQ